MLTTVLGSKTKQQEVSPCIVSNCCTGLGHWELELYKLYSSCVGLRTQDSPLADSNWWSPQCLGSWVLEAAAASVPVFADGTCITAVYDTALPLSCQHHCSCFSPASLLFWASAAVSLLMSWQTADPADLPLLKLCLRRTCFSPCLLPLCHHPAAVPSLVVSADLTLLTSDIKSRQEKATLKNPFRGVSVATLEGVLQEVSHCWLTK